MDRGSSENIVRRLRQQAEADSLAEQPDSQLVQRFLAGRDEAAFTALVLRHGPMVLGVCRRVLDDWHATEDVFQATFLVLARRAASIRKSASVASWLYGVAYRLAIRVRTRTGSRHQRERAAPQPAVKDPVEEASEREIAAILDEELGRLPDRYRAALLLCYLGGATREQAAQKLGLPLRTLQRRLEHGRNLLRTRLRRRGLLVAAGACTATLSHELAMAAVPVGLSEATVSAALAGTPSRAVAALAGGLLRSMRLAAWRTPALIAMIGCALVGVGLGAHAFGVAQPVPSRAADDRQANPAPAPQGPVTMPARAPARETAPFHHAGSVTCIAVSPDGKTVASGGDSADAALRLWDGKTGRELYQRDIRCAVRAVAFSRAGHLAVGCEDRTIRLFQASTGKALHTLQGHQDSAPAGAHSFLPHAPRGVSAVAFTDDARTLISGGSDGTVRLWEVSSGKQVDVLPVTGHRVHQVALSSDRRTLAAGCESLAASGHHPVRLWDLTTRQPIRPDLPPFKGIYSNGAVTALAFATDGKRLAVGGFDNEITVWDVDTGKAVGAFRNGILMRVQSLAYSPTGDRLAAGCSDGRVHFWDGARARPLRQFMAHSGAGTADVQGVSAVAFAPDGQTLFTGGSDKRVRRWDAAAGTERLVPQ